MHSLVSVILVILVWVIGVESIAIRKGYKMTYFNSTVPLANLTVPLANLTVPLANSTVPLANSTVPLAETLVNVTRVYKKRFQVTNISSPSITNTTIVSAAMARLAPVSMEPVLKVPQAAKTKTWVPTCPSSMPTMCPKLTNITASVKKTSAFPSIVVSAAPPQKIQKYCNRPYLRGGTINNNNNNSEKKNLRGSL